MADQTYTTTQGTVTPQGVVNFDPNTGKKLDAGQSVTVNPGNSLVGAVPTPATIVTSGQSRANYSDNLNTLNGANTSLQQGTSNSTTTKDTTITDTTKGKDTTITDTSSVIDPTIKKMFDDNIAALDTSSQNAKTAMDAATATLADDPAAVAAAENIKRKFDVLIQQQKDKNTILLGSYSKNSARTGMLQYANEMDTSFKSMEFDKATQRVSDLVQKENDAIAKSNAAFKAGDVKALDAATKEYQKTLTDKQKAIMDFNKVINDAVKQIQAENKQQQEIAKQTITDDIRISTALGKTVADTIATSGIKDQTQIDSYIDAMAEQSGITNSDILRSAVVKATQDAQKLQLGNQNTQLTIDTKKKKLNSTPTGSSTFKISPAIAQVTPQFEAVKGSDGYIDPYKWVSARTNWNKAGGSDASFNTSFKKYLNPASYSIAGFKTTTGKKS